MSKQYPVAGSSKSSAGRRPRLIAASAYLMLKRGKRYLPPVVRAVLGVILVCLGLLGFLPILGFWMIPLGLALIATDVPPVGRWLRRRLHAVRKRSRHNSPSV